MSESDTEKYFAELDQGREFMREKVLRGDTTGIAPEVVSGVLGSTHATAERSWIKQYAAKAVELKPGESLQFNDIDSYVNAGLAAYERDTGQTPADSPWFFFSVLNAVVDVLRETGRKYEAGTPEQRAPLAEHAESLVREWNEAQAPLDSDPHEAWAMWQIRKARHMAHMSGETVERSLLVRCLLFGHEGRAYYPPGWGLGNAQRRLHELLTTLPPEELAPLPEPEKKPAHDHARAWVKSTVAVQRALALEDGRAFPAMLRDGAAILEGRRLFPGIDVDSMVFEEGLNHEPLPDRQSPESA